MTDTFLILFFMFNFLFSKKEIFNLNQSDWRFDYTEQDYQLPQLYQPFFTNWKFRINPLMNNEKVKVLDFTASKPRISKGLEKCKHNPAILIVKRTTGDTIRLLIFTEDIKNMLPTLRVSSAPPPQCNYGMNVNWGEEFNPDGSKTPIVIPTLWDKRAEQTEFAVIH